MILFRPQHVTPILEGRKTQTRRLGKKRWRVGSVHQCKLVLFGKPFARVRNLDVRQERLGDMPDDALLAEGYGSFEKYREAFERINGWWDPDLMTWVIDFELVKEAA